MDNITHRPNGRQLVGGALVLSCGFVALIAYSWAWWALCVAGFFAWMIVFREDGRQAFKFPRKIWLIFIGVVAYFAISICLLKLSKLVGLEWADNPVTGQLRSFIFKLPIMMMGEEFLGIGILEASESKGFSLVSSTLLSAVVFGLLHMFVYWDGSVFSTIAHVLLLQGVSRLIFNYIYIQTGRSIWGSWATHMLVDIIALYVGSQMTL